MCDTRQTSTAAEYQTNNGFAFIDHDDIDDFILHGIVWFEIKLNSQDYFTINLVSCIDNKNNCCVLSYLSIILNLLYLDLLSLIIIKNLTCDHEDSCSCTIGSFVRRQAGLHGQNYFFISLTIFLIATPNTFYNYYLYKKLQTMNQTYFSNSNYKLKQLKYYNNTYTWYTKYNTIILNIKHTQIYN